MPYAAPSTASEHTLRCHLMIMSMIGRCALLATMTMWSLPSVLSAFGALAPWSPERAPLPGALVIFILTEGSRWMYETHRRHRPTHPDGPSRRPTSEEDACLALPVSAREWRLHRFYDRTQTVAKLGVMVGLAEAGVRTLLGPPPQDLASVFATPLVLLSLLALGIAACADVFLLGAAARRGPPTPPSLTHRIDLARWSRCPPPRAGYAPPIPSPEPTAPSSVSPG